MNSALDAIVCMDIKGNVILEPSGSMKYLDGPKRRLWVKLSDHIIPG
jgi:hypothetical protein